MTSAQQPPPLSPRRRVTPFDNPVARFLAGRLGIRLFLLSLGILFATTILASVVIRIQIDEVWPRDLPALPGLLWFSTLVLVISSGTMQGALVAARGDRPSGAKLLMAATLSLGFLFLALQAGCWWSWFEVVNSRWAESAEYRFALSNFYVLTGLHALHVVGGLIPMFLVTRNAFAERYSSSSHAGMTYCTMYWHFLDCVWIVLFIVLMIGK